MGSSVRCFTHGQFRNCFSISVFKLGIYIFYLCSFDPHLCISTVRFRWISPSYLYICVSILTRPMHMGRFNHIITIESHHSWRSKPQKCLSQGCNPTTECVSLKVIRIIMAMHRVLTDSLVFFKECKKCIAVLYQRTGNRSILTSPSGYP